MNFTDEESRPLAGKILAKWRPQALQQQQQKEQGQGQEQEQQQQQQEEEKWAIYTIQDIIFLSKLIDI